MGYFFNSLKESLLLGWEDFKADFILNFIKDDRWKLLAEGLGATLQITALFFSPWKK